MKVLVVGANGKIGRILVNKLQNEKEFQVRAMVRSEEQANALKERGVDAVVTDLEGTVEHIGNAMDGCDAVVFTAGSGSKTGPDKTLTVDLDGAVKTIEAAEAKGVKRFVMVSALQANNREKWSMKIKHYYVAKHYADRILMDSDLDYTIVKPGALLDEPGSGNIQIGESLERGSVPREDVASTIVEVLRNPKTVRRSFDLVSGDVSISEAIANL
ncbi:SDR family oxidoreductase [Pallidibacillus pasinlerensis]|uniref:SDR family oxidoreductase n=1 Tax=Pallidibacillus pasinlerensis TaxID=2703818 RepID=A0ABX0A735_9BACI|nr:SDR family oxidoreductase [Pallidibacillus pasinlerensis]NCU18060.1 SDR family oxidoreductase [Pallidibacillus pasinlerensis]